SKPLSYASWQTVTVPHIFRQSGLPDDTAGWYRQTFTATEADRARRFLLVLDGAASVKDVFVNGRYIGRHKSAYTGATFDLTPGLHFDQPNTLLVRVSNRGDETHAMIARSPLYYVNGGLFRHARLVKTSGAVHLFPEFGSTGVYHTPAKVSAEQADLSSRTWVSNPRTTPAAVVVRHTVLAPDGSVAARFEAAQTLPPGQTAALTASTTLATPKLWDFGQPHVYSVRTEVLADGALSDSVTEPLGFRTIALRDGQFYLNGRQVQLRGVNKHEQSEYAWNAVGDAEPLREWQLITEMGGNTVRLAHYPHSHLDYSLGDRNGLGIWAENGFAGHYWEGGQADDMVVTTDGERQTREMVRQNWNHPSILFWSCGNETVGTVASRYATVIREEDPTGNRLITYAISTEKPENCDFLAYNTYEGWYGDRLSQFSANPRNAFVSETGAGDWLSHHVPFGAYQWTVDKFEPEEYAALFTEYRLQTVCRNAVEKHPMFLWWNFREFYDRKFKNNRNTKGLITLAAYPKDLYYLFKTFFNPAVTTVRLTGSTHFYRAFAADNGIKAYANVPALELTINGVSQGKKANGDYRIPDGFNPPNKQGKSAPVTGIPVDNVFFWKAPLTPGRNVIEVSDGAGHTDRMIVYQAADANGTPAPAAPTALVQDLRSSNPASPAVFIDRPVEAQLPFYTAVDGSSDNTFDLLPAELTGAAWIGTRRLSDPALKTDLSFRVNPASSGATAYVLFSTGSHPAVTLKPTRPELVAAAAQLQVSLAAAGFRPTGTPVVWRDHDLNRADAALWTRTLAPGETLALPGHTLDYVVLLKPAAR
ncbi:MAG: hypothetical protein RL376_1012, partial [Verrucomicrobiota bacterium]